MLSNDPNTDSEANLEELLLKLEQRLMDPVFSRMARGFPPYWLRIFANLAPRAAFVKTIVPELVQVTYRTLKRVPGDKPQAALRSSLWIRRGDKWQMLFHQGTKVPDV
ncbi:MAG: hypothetical protein WAK56_06575 [Candidatus Sulfotelmatobacter sp.]